VQGMESVFANALVIANADIIRAGFDYVGLAVTQCSLNSVG
jgi:hypothetical protein